MTQTEKTDFIKFAGALSDECFLCIGKGRKRKQLVFWQAFLWFWIGMTISSFFVTNNESRWVFLAFTFLLAICVVWFALVRVKIDSEVSAEHVLTILNGHISQMLEGLDYPSIPVEKVRKVIDFGYWYIIVFGRTGTIGNGWPCQKNLIEVGTLEDFEKIFEGKIKRRT